jgi:hypothetical protein
MHLGDPDTKRQQRIVLGFAAFFFILIFIAYYKELGDVLILGWARLKTLINQPLQLPDHVYESERKIFYNLLWGVLFTGLFWIVLVSQQAILPVRPWNFPEVLRAGWHLILWILQQHGQAIFVRDGKSNFTERDAEREGPGVVVVDFNSAVVLETQISALGLSRRYSGLLQAFSLLLGLSEKPESPRVRGAGIVFTLPRERIRGVVDLRKQFRLQPGVRCYTRDGIEITANVHCTFTLGQDPDVLLVTYEGEPQPWNLRVITFETVSEGYLRVKSISDSELDVADGNEINQVYRVVTRSGEWFNYPGRPTPPIRHQRRGDRLRPKYDRDRVFAAVSAQARSSSTNQDAPIIWSELPVRVACDFYREIFTSVNFDEIYNFTLKNRTSPFQLQRFRRRLMVRMRGCGMLSYQFVFHKDGAKFEAGRVYHCNTLSVSDVLPLRNPKVLRDRGIKVIHSSFGDPSPVSELVIRQRLEAWRATWDRDLEVRMAESDLRSMKLRSHAHAQALRDLAYSLTKIVEDRPYSDEAAAIRILQALEAAATDAKTRQLLPGNTMDMLKYIGTLLPPKDPEVNKVGRLPNEPY